MLLAFSYCPFGHKAQLFAHVVSTLRLKILYSCRKCELLTQMSHDRFHELKRRLSGFSTKAMPGSKDDC